MTTQAASVPDADEDDIIVQGLKRRGLAVTRENYIDRNWPETPEPWTAEHEAELPASLQDWSVFERP
jgi:hypothetical protein